jgi:hypothetical protein
MRFIKKLNWQEGQQLLHDDKLREILNDLSPADDFNLYHISYEYGDLLLEDGVFQIPNEAGDGLIALNSDDVPKALQNDIDYNYFSNPAMQIVKNCLEFYLPIDNRIVPCYGIMKPGNLIGTWNVIMPENRTIEPSFRWKMTAGARSTVILPKVSREGKNLKLRQTLHLDFDTPATLQDHFQVFKAISTSMEKKWTMEILVFGKKWFANIEDKAFSGFHRYLLQNAWVTSNYWRTNFVEELLFSIVQIRKGLKFPPEVMSTIRHTIAIGLGAYAGFSPASDDSAAPVSYIQEAYRELYKIHQFPHILHHKKFDLSDPNQKPTYYSFNYPSGVSTVEGTSAASYKKELASILYYFDRYRQELLKPDLKLSPSLLVDLFEQIEFSYIHADIDKNEKGFITPKMLPEFDPRFQVDGDLPFAESSPFFKGAIMLHRKKK